MSRRRIRSEAYRARRRDRQTAELRLGHTVLWCAENDGRHENVQSYAGLPAIPTYVALVDDPPDPLCRITSSTNSPTLSRTP